MQAHFLVARSTDWPCYFGAKGEPARARGRVWVEQSKSEITSLTDVLGAVDVWVAMARGMLNTRVLPSGGVVARGAASPRAPACIGVVVDLGLQANGDAFSSLGAVTAGMDRPLELPWAGPCRLNALEEPMCP
jgi:hypothetical protein